MDKSLVAQSISYHGQPLQKIWEGERGENDLQLMGFVHPDFSIYQTRQKHLSIQDRTKRLKLHQFIAKKADFLFGIHFSHSNDVHKHDEIYPENSFAIVPPFETFFSTKMDKVGRTKHFFEQIKIGDIVFATFVSKTANVNFLKILCTAEPNVLYTNDLNVKAYLPTGSTIPGVDRKGNPRGYTTNDLLCCEVAEVVPDAEKMMVTMKGAKRLGNEITPPLGLVHKDALPEAYKLALDCEGVPYDKLLEGSSGFLNPSCIDTLSHCVGLNTKETPTNMSGLHGRFPQHEYANELRQVQASKWAFRSVAEGIEHFKEGRHSEAFQCLNKALNIDPRNVEGLVARGALYANSGSFKKAVEDFETALKLNPSHANARKYMGETLVALGRSYEEESKFEDAKKAYQDCLAIIPQHEEANTSLEFLRTKSNKQLIEPNELLSGNLLNLSDLKRGDLDKSKDKKAKKKKSKNRKRKNSSTSSSSDSSDSSDSSSSESSSSDSSSSSGSDQSKSKRKKRSKELVLSPLSRRALMEFGSGPSGGPGDRNFPFNQPPFGANEAQTDIYEANLRKFLALRRDEDNYEEKVRLLVDEATRLRNERKPVDEKSKKREKKKSKKSKKDSKKKRKEKKSKSTRKDKDAVDDMDFKEAMRIIKTLPGFGKMDDSKRHKPDSKPEGEKWKMMFNKDDRKRQISEASSSKPNPRQYAFSNDDESDTDRNYFNGPDKNKTSAKSPEKEVAVRPSVQASSSAAASSRHPKFQDQPANIQRMTLPPAGTVVLDKFGNFRLASTEKKPPEPSTSSHQTVATRRSFSRTRRFSSRSRSRSRSRSVRRRSRSRSYGRRYSRSRSRTIRSRSRSRSRSYSRSRSRSVSVDRRRGGRARGRGGFERGTYYKPRPWGGRGRGGFEFRGGRGRDRYQSRGGRNGGSDRGNRRGGYHDFRYNNRYSRSRSMSDDRGRSPINERDRDRYSDSDTERKDRPDRRGERNFRNNKSSPGSKSGKEVTPKDGKIDANASLEDMEKFIDKAKREHKEDMLERNRDLIKKEPLP